MPRARAREAERLLRDVLALRLRGPDTNHWRIPDAQNRLGFALVAVAALDPSLTLTQRVARFDAAETLLHQSAQVLKTSRRVADSYRRDALVRIIRLYEAWDAAAPGTGQTAKAAQWHEALADFDRAAAAAKKSAAPPSP